MATYRLSVKVIARSAGRSATGAAAYRAATRITDRRSGLVHDYRRRGGVVHAEILAPSQSPQWVLDRAELWNRVEESERRKDAQLCREVLLSLPHELSDDRRKELVREFVREAFVAHGMIADVAIHRAHERSDQRNHHAHVLLTLRNIEASGFGSKARAWNEKALLLEWRQSWERSVNRELERARVPERVSARSLAAQGIDREPEPRQGPVATRMERAGRRSHAGDDRRAARARNAERERLSNERRHIEAQIRDEERRQGPSRGRTETEVSSPGIRPANLPPWQASREQLLSAMYEKEIRDSKLARYWRIERSSEGLVFENARGRFEDRGELVVAKNGNALEIRGMLDVAELKGWNELTISGSEPFKRAAMATAIERGFAVRAEGRDADILREIQHICTNPPSRERSASREYFEGWTR